MKAILIAGIVLAAATTQAAPDGAALAQKNGCLACHAVDHKVVGPAYKDVAAKYKGDKGAAAKLVAKVKAGGSGTWGAIPMPPQPASEADVKVIVDWVLAQK